MGQRPLSRREQEERRKREEEQAAASVCQLLLSNVLDICTYKLSSILKVFKEFVETFQEAPSSVAKVWVKAGTYDAGSRSKIFFSYIK